jgi:ABC-type amino acid transport substrate-binding protein
MPKGLQYDDLRQRVNAAIARYTAEGWLRQRATFWGLPTDKTTDKTNLLARLTPPQQQDN